jgi:hypothetical protein
MADFGWRISAFHHNPILELPLPGIEPTSDWPPTGRQRSQLTGRPSLSRFDPDRTWLPGIFLFHFQEAQSMSTNDQDNKPDRIVYHLGAIVAGLVLMVLGVGLSVTMVLLPVGLPLGLLGFGIFIWGLTPGWRK